MQVSCLQSKDTLNLKKFQGKHNIESQKYSIPQDDFYLLPFFSLEKRKKILSFQNTSEIFQAVSEQTYRVYALPHMSRSSK